MHLEAPRRAIVETILRAHVPAGVDVFVFGSRAHGRRLKPFSDLDLCLKGDSPVDPDVLVALATAFRESDLPIKVDVIDWRVVSEEFRAAIAPDLVPISLRFTGKQLASTSCPQTP